MKQSTAVSEPCANSSMLPAYRCRERMKSPTRSKTSSSRSLKKCANETVSKKELIMKKILAQTGKELRQFSRDKLTVTLALVLPLILMWLIGMSISLSVTDLPLAIRDMDQSPLSRQYVETLGVSLTFRVVPSTATGPVESVLDKEEARAVVVIPENFGSDLQRGRS